LMYLVLFICSSVYGHLGCFYFLAIITSITVQICVHILCACIYFSCDTGVWTYDLE
jgi:hypothetical protein